MKRIVVIFAVAACAVCLPANAQADFGVAQFDVAFSASDGSPATHAGSHPFAFTTSVDLNLDGEEPDGRLKDLTLEWPTGVVANTMASPSCLQVDFEQLDEGFNDCSDMTAVGIATGFYDEAGKSATAPIYNLVPASGSLMSLGFRVADATNVILDIGLEQEQPHRLSATVRTGLPESIELFGLGLQLWGVPADPAHDESRGHCVGGAGECPVGVEQRPLLTLPTSCDGPLESNYEALSWGGDIVTGSSLTHDGVGTPQGLTGCGVLAFSPLFDIALTTGEANSPTGLDLSLEFSNEGISNPSGLAESTVRESALVLPEGIDASALTASAGACSEAAFATEGVESEPGDGCPVSSQVGTAEVESPLLAGPVEGSVFRATPFANATDTPMALYLALEDSALGILVKQPIAIEPDSETDQLIAYAEELPQLPFSDLELHLPETVAGPLTSPPFCGEYDMTASFSPWSGDPPYLIPSTLEIGLGPNEGPCPGEEEVEDPLPTEQAHGGTTSSTVALPSVPSPPVQAAPHRRHCPKGKRRVRRNGRTRCLNKHHRRSGEARGSL